MIFDFFGKKEEKIENESLARVIGPTDSEKDHAKDLQVELDKQQASVEDFTEEKHTQDLIKELEDTLKHDKTLEKEDKVILKAKKQNLENQLDLYDKVEESNKVQRTSLKQKIQDIADYDPLQKIKDIEESAKEWLLDKAELAGTVYGGVKIATKMLGGTIPNLLKKVWDPSKDTPPANQKNFFSKIWSFLRMGVYNLGSMLYKFFTGEDMPGATLGTDTDTDTSASSTVSAADQAKMAKNIQEFTDLETLSKMQSELEKFRSDNKKLLKDTFKSLGYKDIPETFDELVTKNKEGKAIFEQQGDSLVYSKEAAKALAGLKGDNYSKVSDYLNKLVNVHNGETEIAKKVLNRNKISSITSKEDSVNAYKTLNTENKDLWKDSAIKFNQVSPENFSSLTADQQQDYLDKKALDTVKDLQYFKNPEGIDNAVEASNANAKLFGLKTRQSISNITFEGNNNTTINIGSFGKSGNTSSTNEISMPNVTIQATPEKSSSIDSPEARAKIAEPKSTAQTDLLNQSKQRLEEQKKQTEFVKPSTIDMNISTNTTTKNSVTQNITQLPVHVEGDDQDFVTGKGILHGHE